MDLPLEIRVHDENGDSCLDSDDELVGCEIHNQLKMYHKMLRQLHTEVRYPMLQRQDPLLRLSPFTETVHHEFYIIFVFLYISLVNLFF